MTARPSAVKSWQRALLKNLLWATGSEGMLRVLRLVTITLLVRWLGPTEYGRYAYAFAFASMFSIVLDAGTSTALTRIISGKPTFVRFLPNIVCFKLCLVTLGLTCLCIVVLVSAPDRETRAVALLMGAFFGAQEFINLFYVVLRSVNRFRDEFVMRLWYSLGSMCVVLGCVYLYPSARAGAVAQALVAIVAGGLIYSAIRSPQALRHWARYNVRVGKLLLLTALPLAVISGASVVYANVDIVILGHLYPMAETGLYSAAARLIYIAQLPTAIVGLVSFPTLAAGIRRRDGDVCHKWNALFGGMIFLSIPISMATFICAPDILSVIFGEPYAVSGNILSIMALALPPLYVYPLFLQVLIMFGVTRQLLIASVISVFVVCALYAAMIKSLGPVGAAWCFVASTYGLAVVFGFMIHRTSVLGVTQPLATVRNASAILAAGGAAVAVWWAPDMGGVVRIALCVTLFSVFYLAVSAVRWVASGRRHFQL